MVREREVYDARALRSAFGFIAGEVFDDGEQDPAHDHDVIAVEAGNADIVLCATNSKKPVFDGAWLQPGQMVVSIVNSDVIDKKSEVDETVYARAEKIVVNTWESVVANQQVELLDPIAKGIVKREDVVEIGDVVSGGVSVRQTRDNIIYYKNNTGLAIQFAACGAILYEKMLKEGTNRVIPAEWFASEKYTTPVR
jgi:ornithine cyclodeaminase/alanine dehydrogenase-like protein (mu-crystallin family)